MNGVCQLDTIVSRDVMSEQGSVAARTTFSRLCDAFRRASSWIVDRSRKQHTRKLLKLCETVSLGEKRFVAVVQVANERFLIGGASSSISLLARLDPDSFTEVLRSRQQAEQV